MREHGYVFEVMEPTIDEPALIDSLLGPAALAEAISFFKAASVARGLDAGWIIGGDTVVAAGEEIFGKPSDRDDARRILQRIAGTNHEVLTGITILDTVTGRRQIAHDRTTIVMRPFSDDELESYLNTNAWMGKAGAYGIQDYGDAFVMSIEGSFTNVVGMPMELVKRMLSSWGFEPGNITDRPDL
jgi:septum formation protein